MIVEPSGRVLPAPGSVQITRPLGTEADGSLVLDVLKPSPWSRPSASPSVRPVDVADLHALRQALPTNNVTGEPFGASSRPGPGR